MAGPYSNDQANPAAATPQWPAAIPGGTVAGFQQTVTASAAALTTQAFSSSFTIKAFSTNTGVTYVGGAGVTAATGFPLAAGQSVVLNLASTASVYIIGTASDKVAVIGN